MQVSPSISRAKPPSIRRTSVLADAWYPEYTARMVYGQDIYTLPPDLPRPVDDGRARHLTGTRVPPLALQATTGERIDLGAIPGRAVIFAYPRTGKPGQPPLTPD